MFHVIAVSGSRDYSLLKNSATEKFLFTEDPTKNVSEIFQCGEKWAKNCRALKLNPEYLTIKPSTLKSQFLNLLPGKLLNSHYSHYSSVIMMYL